MFNKLKELGEWKGANPLEEVKPFKDHERTMAFLQKELGVTLPSGQASHVLRHTFASHFMMNGGNILVLRDILGHADISMTMRYAHFAPDHLSEAISHNPLSNL